MRARWPACGRLWLVALVACLVLGRAAVADMLRGVLRSADPRTRQIVVTDRDRDHNRFTVAAAARITLNGRRATLADLRVGDQVVVTFHEDAQGRGTATGVAAVRRREPGSTRPAPSRRGPRS